MYNIGDEIVVNHNGNFCLATINKVVFADENTEYDVKVCGIGINHLYMHYEVSPPLGSIVRYRSGSNVYVGVFYAFEPSCRYPCKVYTGGSTASLVPLDMKFMRY